MSAKKRDSPTGGSPENSSAPSGGSPASGGNGQRRGVSGDPAMRALAYQMAGGATPAPWWPGSHQRVIAMARAASWPDDRLELEDLTCQLVGGELYECLRQHGSGHHPAQWLVALTETAAAALRSALTARSGADSGFGADSDPGSGTGGRAADWRGLWALLRGIALIAPASPDDPRAGTTVLARRYFPDIKDPRAVALAEAEEAARLLAGHGLAAAPPGGGCRAAGSPRLARDAYGSRFLLAAPFTYDDGDGPHWYAWDIDACWLDVVVGAGTHPSAADALADWRDAVGEAAAGAELTECPPELTVRLLAQTVTTDAFSDAARGDEPRALLEEHYRRRTRASALSSHLGDPPPGAGSFMVDMDSARDEFLAWYADRHGPGAVSAGMAEAVDTITDQWGPHKDIDDRGFYACSPHRIELAARLIRNGDYAEHAAPAIRLLPDWTQWCAERGGLDSGPAARAREAAATATALADATAAIPDQPAAPLRRPE